MLSIKISKVILIHTDSKTWQNVSDMTLEITWIYSFPTFFRIESKRYKDGNFFATSTLKKQQQKKNKQIK